jgi:hypothetical protein
MTMLVTLASLGRVVGIQRFDALEKASGGQESGQVSAMFGTRQPGLAAVW